MTSRCSLENQHKETEDSSPGQFSEGIFTLFSLLAPSPNTLEELCLEVAWEESIFPLQPAEVDSGKVRRGDLSQV